MQVAVHTEKQVARRVPSVTHADSKHKGRNRFGRYGPEQEQAVRMPEVVENETLRQLRDAWKRFDYNMQTVPEKNYATALIKIDKIECTAEDVRKFSVVLAEFQGEEKFAFRAGIFLSALINKSSGNDFVIHTNHLDVTLYYFGFLNTKNITVIGDTGGSFGSLMQGGNVAVKGNAGLYVGYRMQGGTIVVERNAANCAGDEMNGGIIVVEGNAAFVGRDMKGGEIHIKGNLTCLGIDTKGGNIYHKGRLIVEDGRLLDPSIPIGSN